MNTNTGRASLFERLEPRPRPIRSGPRLLLAWAFTSLLLGVAHLQASTNPVSLSIALTGTPGRQTPELTWPSQTGAVYQIQARTDLAPGGKWETIEPVSAESNLTRWKAPELNANSDTRFFRIALPEPAIFSIEPAAFVFSGPIDLYVIGQCLDTNTELRIGPLALTNRTIVNPGLLRVTFTPQSPGTYKFDLARAGAILSSFLVQCYDAATPPASVLQGPPDEPWASPTAPLITPAALKVKEKGNRTKCTSNLRVMPSGEVCLDEVDLFIPGRGLDFVWGRRYLSRSGPTTAQGNRWDFAYNVSVREVAGGMELRDGMGRVDVLTPDADGVYGRDEFFGIGQFSNSLFRITFPDSGYWEFSYPSGPNPGRLLRIIDRNGNTIRLEYDGLNRLERIVDTLGRTNTLTYNPATGKIVSLTDFTGRRVNYGYYRTGDQGGNDGDLRSVTSPAVTGTPNGNDFPQGKTTTYAYSRGFADPRENSLLLTITDPKGQTAFRHVYQHNQTDLEFLRCIGRQVGTTNDRMTYSYLRLTPSPTNRFATQKVIINDRMGNVAEYFHDARNRLLTLREFTGRAVTSWQVSDTTNRPTGKLRASDPAYFETRFEWNNDSLCTRVVHPRGNSTEMIYQRAFNQNSARSNHPKRHDADLRVLRERACCGGADTDGDGINDTDELVTRLEHDPRFGAGLNSSFMHDEDGDVGLSVSVRIITDRDTGRSKGFGFIKEETGQEGAVSTATFSPTGDLLHTETLDRRSGQTSSGDFEYKASSGRLSSITYPADAQGCRRVDTFDYNDVPGTPGYGYLRRRTNDAGNTVCGNTPHFVMVTNYEHDERGNLTRCTDPRGFDTLYTYNSLDQLVQAQTPANTVYPYIQWKVDLSFDANDNLVRVDTENRDHTGALGTHPFWRTEYQYDVLDRLTACCVDKSGTLVYLCDEYQYDSNGNLALHRSPEAVAGHDLNAVTRCEYDERDMPFREVCAPGTGLCATNVLDYDPNGNCQRVSKVDAFSIKLKILEYPGFDRCARITDSMGNVTTLAYDRKGNLVYERFDGELTDVPGNAGNRRLHETRYEYDDLNRLVRWRPAFFDVFTELAIGPGEAITSFSYAPNGQLRHETDANGRRMSYAYDSASRLLSVTDAKTNVLLYSYDACGNVTNQTSIERSDLGGAEQRFAISSIYDPRGRLVSRADNVGNTDQYFYDSRDHLTRHINPRGNLAAWAYDGLSRRMLAITDLNGDGVLDPTTDSASMFTYDDNSRLIASTDPNGNLTRYAFDSADRHVATTNADQTVERLIWSPRSNLILYGDANGTVISNSYDLLDRCVRRDIAPGTGVAATTTLETFEYDSESRLTRAANNAVSQTFRWDSLSDLIEQSMGNLTLRATHDALGNRLSVTYPSGLNVQHTYDDLDQQTALSATVAGGMTQLASFGYEGPGRLGRVSRANNDNTRINWNGLSNPANAPGDFGWRQVVRVNHARGGGSPVIDQRITTFDRAQNKILRAQTAAFSTGGILQTNMFSYDALNRLNVAETLPVPRTTTYQLDAVGNRQEVIENGASGLYLMNATLPDPADFQMNQYSLTPFGARSYDRNGNQTSIDGPAGSTMFAYDYANRLVAVQRTVGPAFLPLASYAYDALGRRISKTTYPPPPLASTITSWFLDADCDGDGIIEERENGTLKRTIVVPHVFEGKCRVLLTSAGATLYCHEDDLGNVLAITDAAGSVVERYDYDDFGLPHFLDAKGDPLTDINGLPVTSSPAGNPFLFHGMYWDGETGLYAKSTQWEPGRPGKRNAYVDPRTGRGLTHVHGDPHVDTRDGSSWDFGFAGNNPWTPGGGGGGAGGMRAGISTSRSNIRNKSGFTDGEQFGGGGGGGGAMRAGISTSRSNIRHKSGFTDGEQFGGGGGGGGGGAMRAGISTSRSNIRHKSGFTDGEQFGGGGGGGAMRAGISTSRSNIRNRNGFTGDWDGDGVGGGPQMRTGVSTSRSNIRSHKSAFANDDFGSGFGGVERAALGHGAFGVVYPSGRLIVPIAMDKGLR